MRKLAYLVSLPYVLVLNGTMAELPGIFGSLIRLFGMPLMALWLVSLFSSGRVRKPPLYLWLFLCFVLWSGLTAFWSVDVASTSALLYKYLLLFGMALILWDLYRSREDVNDGLQAFILGGYLAVGGIIVNFLHGNAMFASEGRFTAGGFHPDDIALILALGIPIAWHLATSPEGAGRFRGPAFRILNYVYPFAAAFCIVLTGTRGGFLASVPGFLYIVWSFRRASPFFRVSLLACLVGVVLALPKLGLQTEIERLGTAVTGVSGGSAASDPDSLNGRAQLWQAGWQVFSQNPFIGIGSGAFGAATISYTSLRNDEGGALIAHNTFVSVLTETGLIGLVLFLSVLGVVARSIFLQPKPQRDLWLAAFAVWLIGVSSLSFEFRAQTWLLFTFIVVSAHCTEPAFALPSVFVRARRVVA